MLKIVKVPNPILTTKASKIKKIDDAILDLAAEMVETCRKASGIGLAAPQIGKSIRLCVINLEHVGLPPFALINPEVTHKSFKKIELEEGCLSIPGVFGIVKRPASISVRALNLGGKETKFKADGLLARVIQHEVDHLDGILFKSKMIRETTGKQSAEEEKM
jgi:peptide deformylase